MERTPKEIFEENQKECVNEIYRLRKQLRMLEHAIEDMLQGEFRYPDVFDEMPEVIKDCIYDLERAIINYEMPAEEAPIESDIN